MHSSGVVAAGGGGLCRSPRIAARDPQPLRVLRALHVGQGADLVRREGDVVAAADHLARRKGGIRWTPWNRLVG